jgi:hypothetical protein
MTDPIQDLSDRLADMDVTFGDAIATLAQQVAALQQAPVPAVAVVPVPRSWASRAGADEWNELRGWVQGLNDGYSLMNPYSVPGCWASHPGLVEELAALHQAWISAALLQEAGMAAGVGSTDMADWHTRFLWPCLERLKATSQHYQATTCTAAAHNPDTPASR